MAKGPTISTITAAFASASKLNANFAAITTSFSNTVSRDGSTPNAMDADFDMNSKNIVNVNALDVDTLVLGGTTVTAGELPAAPVEVHDFDTKVIAAATNIDTDSNFIRTAGFSTVGDGGGALYKAVGSEPSHALKVQSADDQWWEIVPDATGVNWKQGGAAGDGAANDTTAIQAVMDYAEDEGLMPVKIPVGNYLISVPITLVTGQTLVGCGHTSKITEGGSFTGTELLRYDGTGFCQNVTIRDLQCVGTTVTVAAIGMNSALSGVLRPHINNIKLDIARGIIFDKYVQEARIIDIFSFGSIDLLLHLKGNANYIKGLNKESGTGSTTDPYIFIENHATGNTTGNVFVRTTIEGTTSVNKSAIKMTGVSNITFEDLWLEPTLSNGIAIDITSSKRNVIFRGQLEGLKDTYKFKARSAHSVTFDIFNTDNVDKPLADFLDIDETANITIKMLYSRRGRARILDTERNLTVHEVVNRQQLTSPVAGWNSRVFAEDMTGQNLLVNPSFEAGKYGWTTDGSFNTEEYIASQVGEGLMAHLVPDAPIAFNFRQDFSITSAMVGRDITFTGLMKITGGGSAFAYPRFTGAGVDLLANEFRLEVDTGWGIVSATVRPPQAGTLSVGFRVSNATTSTHIYLDDCCLAFGQKTPINPTKMTSIDLGGATWVMASAAPTTGTWKVGDITWDTAPSAGGTIGWVCTSAGTPGTWKTFGAVTA